MISSAFTAPSLMVTSTNSGVKIQLVVNSTWFFFNFNYSVSFSFRASSHCGKLIPSPFPFLLSIYIWHSLKTDTESEQTPTRKNKRENMLTKPVTFYELFFPLLSPPKKQGKQTSRNLKKNPPWMQEKNLKDSSELYNARICFGKLKQTGASLKL